MSLPPLNSDQDLRRVQNTRCILTTRMVLAVHFLVAIFPFRIANARENVENIQEIVSMLLEYLQFKNKSITKKHDSNDGWCDLFSFLLFRSCSTEITVCSLILLLSLFPYCLYGSIYNTNLVLVNCMYNWFLNTCTLKCFPDIGVSFITQRFKKQLLCCTLYNEL